jgi:hypothetical protein
VPHMSTKPVPTDRPGPVQVHQRPEPNRSHLHAESRSDSLLRVTIAFIPRSHDPCKAFQPALPSALMHLARLIHTTRRSTSHHVESRIPYELLARPFFASSTPSPSVLCAFLDPTLHAHALLRCSSPRKRTSPPSVHASRSLVLPSSQRHASWRSSARRGP